MRSVISAMAIAGYLALAARWAISGTPPSRITGVIALVAAAAFVEQQWEERRARGATSRR